ncbi:hypothetical protein HZB05_00160 [Candidatus Wolfebacteria bacterium]|nr:hypothetical protein [Candidatus Wolfebacteria bacterium]
MKKTLIIIGSLIIVVGLVGGIWYWQKEKAEYNQPELVNQQITLNQEKIVNSTPINSQKIGERLDPISTNTNTSIFEVTKSGGVIFSTDGEMIMEIPEGAVASNIIIGVGIAPPAPEGFGEKYDIYPIGIKLINFIKPVTLKISYNPKMLPDMASPNDLTISVSDPFNFREDITTTVDTANYNVIAIINSIKQNQNYQIWPRSCPSGQYWNGTACISIMTPR